MGDNEKDDDVEVRLVDQQKINAFGRLNQRMKDLQEDLKAKQSLYEQLDDAANEIILADDDEPIKFQFGECFFELTKDGADERLEAEKDKADAEMSEIKDELQKTQDTLAELKTELYARFGKNINLEE